MVAVGAYERPGRPSVLTRASVEQSEGRHVLVRASLRAPSRQSPSGGSPRTHSAVSALGAALSESGSQAVPRRILPCEPCSTLLFHPPSPQHHVRVSLPGGAPQTTGSGEP